MILRILLVFTPLMFVLGCDKAPPREGNVRAQVILAAEPAKTEVPAPKAVEGPKTAEPAKSEVPVAKAVEEPKAAPTGEGFRFADTDAGRLLAKLLSGSPVPPLAPLELKTQSERPLPAYIGFPDMPSAPSARPARYPMPARIDPKPAASAERVPFDLAEVNLPRPEKIEVPEGKPMTQTRLDIAVPLVVPMLSRYTADRASFEDPTVEFTLQSIVTDKLPLREIVATFLRINLPEPFENAGGARIQTPVAEDPNRSIGETPRP
ncbi:MAG: hypothetical protein K8T89_08320 [Planctomycetes bacterium]|nr:hypothetical protein [Planctomycetota bacterium]